MLDKETKEIKILTRGNAIRAKCLDCCCNQPAEVVKCPVYDCPLWPYRLSSHPRSMKYLPKEFSVKDCRAYSTNTDAERETGG